MTDIIQLPDQPAVPGLIFRRFRGPADYAGLSEATNAERLAYQQEWITTTADMENEFNHLSNSDPAHDMIVAEVDGTIAGYVRGEWFVTHAGDTHYFFYPHLDPRWGGQGIRRAMVRWVELRLRQVAAGHPAEAPKSFFTYAPPNAADLEALLVSEGYEPVRYYRKMVRSLAEPIPEFPMPAGLEMRPALPEHSRAIWEADQEAFRDHWGFGERTEEAYQRWLADEVLFQPALWQIAWDVETNEIAGQVRTFIDQLENDTYGRLRGYTEEISVRRPYRRRGLARALIAESLRLQKAKGMTESALTVDSENLTGATRIYEDCGFKTVAISTAYLKPFTIG